MNAQALQELSDYERGRCAAAIEAVGRRDKPLAEVCETSVPVQTIKKILGELLNEYRQGNVDLPCDVRGFIFEMKSGRSTYGFFRESWALRAYSVVRGEWAFTLQDREWIQGLLFGYTPHVIQRFVDAATAAGRLTESPLPKSKSQRFHVLSMEENVRLCSRRFRICNIRSSRISPTDCSSVR